MRVLMFIPVFHPAVGGAERQVRLLTAALAARGVETGILTMKTDPALPETDVSPEGIPVRRIAPRDVAPGLPGVRGFGPVNTLLTGLRIRRAVADTAGRFDVLHAHNLSGPMSPFAVREAAAQGLGTVGTAVSIGEWLDLRVLRRSWLWGRICERWLRRHLDVWQAISAEVARQLGDEAVPPERIVRVANAVHVPADRNALPERASRFLYLGRLAATAPRDVEGLVSAFEGVAARHPAAELAVVGGGDRFEALAARVRASPVAERIRLPGTSEPDVWLAWADVLVQPSFVEGLSNALLEGMAAGLACVAYDIPPNREALAEGEAGALVPTGDRAALEARLEELAALPGAARELGRRAHAHAAATFDVPVVVERLLAVYEAVAEGRGRRGPARAARS